MQFVKDRNLSRRTQMFEAYFFYFSFSISIRLSQSTTGVTLIYLAAIVLTQADMTMTQWYIQKGLTSAMERKDKIGIMTAFTGLGQIAYFCQDFKQMDIHFRASLQLSHETGTLIYPMFSLRILGIALLRQGNLRQTREFYLENLSLSESVILIEIKWVTYDVLTIILGMAGIASELGQANQAWRLLGVVEKEFESFFKPLDICDQAEFDRIASEVSHRLDDLTFDSTWSAVRELTHEQALTEARQVTP